MVAIALLGGCSVSGGVNGSVGGRDSGTRFGINVDMGIYEGTVDVKERYEGQTVYVVPDHRASP